MSAKGKESDHKFKFITTPEGAEFLKSVGDVLLKVGGNTNLQQVMIMYDNMYVTNSIDKYIDAVEKEGKTIDMKKESS